MITKVPMGNHYNTEVEDSDTPLVHTGLEI
jgi:hypothetical protein